MPKGSRRVHEPRVPTPTPSKGLVMGGHADQSRREIKSDILAALQALADRLGHRPTEAEVVGGLRLYSIESVERYWRSLDEALTHVKVKEAPPSGAGTALQRLAAGHPSNRPSFVTGIQFQNPLENAVAFGDPEQHANFLQRNPMTLADIGSILRHQGPSAIVRSWQIHRLAHDPNLPKQPTQIYWWIDLHRTGRVKALHMDVVPFTQDHSPQAVAVSWAWHPGERQYVPLRAAAQKSIRLAEALLAHHGFPLTDTASRALVDEALGYQSDRKKLADLLEVFRAEGAPVVGRLWPLTRKFNIQYHGSPAELRLSLGITFDETFSSLRLEPWGPDRIWEHGHVRANLLFRHEHAQWQLRRYSGPYSLKIQKVIPTTAVIKLGGRVTLVWDTLKDVLEIPAERRHLFQMLWRRDHPDDPFPKRYVFRAHKTDTVRCEDTMARNLAILREEDAQSLQRDKTHAWLHFGPGEGEARLTKIEGNGSGELAEPTLRGDGVVFAGPLERTLILKTLSGGLIDSSAPDQAPPTRQDVLSVFRAHGSHIVAHLIATMRMADPSFPEAPDRLLFTGHEHGKVPSTRIGSVSVSAGERLADTGHSYFGVEYERTASGRYIIADARVRGLGRELAELHQSDPLVIADTIERAIADHADRGHQYLLKVRIHRRTLGDYFAQGRTPLHLWEAQHRGSSVPPPKVLHLYFEWYSNTTMLWNVAVSEIPPERWEWQYAGQWHSHITFQWKDGAKNYELIHTTRKYAQDVLKGWSRAGFRMVSNADDVAQQAGDISAEEVEQNRAEVRRSLRVGHIIADMERAATTILARYGVRIEHAVERALVLRALGVEKMDRQISVATAREFFSTQKDQAVQRLLTVLKPFDAQLAGDLKDGVRISFLQNTAADAVSTFAVVRVTPEVGWAENPDHTQLLFIPHEGRWPLNQYHGISGKEWADVVGVFAPGAFMPPRHWVAKKGQIMPPWGELRETLRDPARRQWLYKLLWRDRYPGRPLPMQRMLVASRNGKSDTIPARALDVLDAIPFLKTDPPAHLARLFSVAEGDRDRLTGFDGRGGQDIARAVLQGDGHLPTHPLEFALVMGHLCRKQFRHPLSLQDVIGYFSQHGHVGVERVVNAVAAVDPVFPKDANRFVIAAWIDGKLEGTNRLVGFKLVQEADFLEEKERGYVLWVEYEKGADGQWRATPSEREAGRMVAAAGSITQAVAHSVLGQDSDYLRKARLPLADLGGYFAKGGTIMQLWQLKKESPGQHPQQLYLYFEWMPGSQRLRALTVSDVQPNVWRPKYKGQWHSHVAFRWNEQRRRYEPSAAPGLYALAVAAKWFEGIGMALQHPVEYALLHGIIGGQGHHTSEKMTTQILGDYFAKGVGPAVHRLFDIASQVDPRLGPHTRLLKFSVGVESTYNSFYGVTLEPWQWRSPMLRSRAQLVMGRTERGWELVQLGGHAVKILVPELPLKTAVRVLDAGSRVPIAMWSDLVAVFRRQGLLRDMIQTLWRRDGAAKGGAGVPMIPLPDRFLLVAVKHHDPSGLLRVHTLEMIPVAGNRYPKFKFPVARLLLSNDNDSLRPLAASGSGAADLIDGILEGEGTVVHPVERAFVMGRLGVSGQEAMDSGRFYDYFRQFGRQALPQLLHLLGHVGPPLPSEPTIVSISGVMDGDRVGGLRLWTEDISRKDFSGGNYFVIHFDKTDTGYQLRHHNHRSVNRMAQALAEAENSHDRGGIIIAPDADATAEAAEKVRRLAQVPKGFASIEPMSRPKPMITPAELKKIEPLVNVPIKVENKIPGFMPTEVEWKDLALRPSDKRFAGDLPKPNPFELLLIGVLSFWTGLSLMRNVPMESFGGGGVFFNSNTTPYTEGT